MKSVEEITNVRLQVITGGGGGGGSCDDDDDDW